MAQKLLDQARDTARLKHLSIRTENAYLQWIKRFILFHHKRHPIEMGENEIRSFLTYLACDKYVSSSTQNQALNAIIFLYSQVLYNGWLRTDNFQNRKHHNPFLHMDSFKLTTGMIQFI